MASLFDWFDVVATQGARLVPRRWHTPVWEKTFDEEFVVSLCRELRGVEIVQKARRIMYHEAADEWPIGRTPPELREKRKAEVEAIEALWDVSDSSDSDHERDDANERVGTEKGVARSRRLPQPYWLPTPPLATDGPLLPPPRKKRRRVSGEDEEDDEEKKRPAKRLSTSIATGISPAETPLADGSREKGSEAAADYEVNHERGGGQGAAG